MDAFFERLMAKAATLDELLSDDFEVSPEQGSDADLAERRLAAWCRSSADGDWTLFSARLARDGWSIDAARTRLGCAPPRAGRGVPAWLDDAIWVEAAIRSPDDESGTAAPPALAPYPFVHLFVPVLRKAEDMLWAGLDVGVSGNLTETARACLRHALLRDLSDLAAPALYERFAAARKSAAASATETDAKPTDRRALYDRFFEDMKAGDIRRLFEAKPVLLRLIASLTRQWIEATREFVRRLDLDLAAIRRDLLQSDTACRVDEIVSGLSDRHNDGRSVLVVRFEDGARVVYKPKDLGPDAAWYTLVESLNGKLPPVDLRTPNVFARDGYGWSEFIAHTGCANNQGCRQFFRRAGAWLALFHCFAGSDMHQDNMIAAGDHPVPIDLEMILQASTPEQETGEPEAQAFEAALEIVDNSVLMVGLVPAYGRLHGNDIVAKGGLNAGRAARAQIAWRDINSDAMRPIKAMPSRVEVTNLPHVDGRYARFDEHLDDFIAGFEDYAAFLISQRGEDGHGGLLDGFAGLPVRKVIRPTQFYDLLIQRLRDHRHMDDGGVWSAQADFLARLTDWDRDADPLGPLQRAERAALLMLNVPHFRSPSDAADIADARGISVRTGAVAGLARARARMDRLDAAEIAWQVEVIRQNTATAIGAAVRTPAAVGDRPGFDAEIAPTRAELLAEASRIADDLERHAIRRGPSAAWVGLDWLGDSDVAQLVPLGPDLYNGAGGIGLFLAAHAATTGHASSRQLALAAVAHLRKSLRGRNAARMARSLGTGGATGLGSILYAFSVMATCLRDDDLMADAHATAGLFSDALIAADRQLDVVGGCAGGILGLLRLYRDAAAPDVLARAVRCGEHLLAQPRSGDHGGSWLGQGRGEHALTGMSHGAAGFAYALASLAAASGREEFATAASQCIGFENATYDSHRHNWRDFRGKGDAPWPCQWCHGAPGIGMARAATLTRASVQDARLKADVRNALVGVERDWPGHVDTLCCGTLGSIEFFCEAADALGDPELRDHASRCAAAVLKQAARDGDYRWNVGKRQFNLGLFRGLAGVGYTMLRRADRSLPNVLVWE